MRAFEVSLNGKKLCLAGIGDDGVLTAIVNWVPSKGKGDLFLQVGGLVSSSDEHVSWESQRPLRVADTIEVKIINAERLRNASALTLHNGWNNRNDACAKWQNYSGGPSKRNPERRARKAKANPVQ